ncbi:MAG: glycine zipper 2TM domain-containing protein [Flavisolibacter sp.]
MKKMIPMVIIAALFLTACTSNTRTRAEAAMDVDTSGLAEFQAFKQQQAIMDQMAAYQMAQGNATANQSSGTARKTPASRSSGSSNRTVYNSESSSAAKATQKKGWSKAAKGAVIGGVAGGVAGAVIHKRNRAVGGVVGAVVGAGGGYAIGRGMDKKDGRY